MPTKEWGREAVLTIHQSYDKWRGRRIRTVNADTEVVPACFPTFQQAIHAPNRVYIIYKNLI
jgi:hypothetical protein